MRRDEARKCWTGNRAKQKCHMQDSECATTLMQEEQIDDNARAKHCGHSPKEAGEKTRNNIRNVVICARHDSTPNLTYQCEKDTPKNRGASAKHVGYWREEEWAGGHAGQGC